MKYFFPNGVNLDITFARDVVSGNGDACKRFVEDYTDLVLYRVWELMKSHCHYPAKERICCLIILQKQRKNVDYLAGADQCDECMDSYIWFFKFLKKRIRTYRGINNCSLKTYVWSLVNSHNTYIDWLRWRYGRAY